MSIQPKKKNLFKYFKSKEFNEARIKMCAIYIILSYINELHEDVDRDLQGFDGLFIGELKKYSMEATKAFDLYEKSYRYHIGSDGLDLGEATIDVTSELDDTLKKNRYFFQQCYNVIANSLNTQIENRVKDPEQIDKEQSDNFEICGPNERKLALEETLNISRKRLDEFNGDVLKGVEVGFNTAINFINRIYLES